MRNNICKKSACEKARYVVVPVHRALHSPEQVSIRKAIHGAYCQQTEQAAPPPAEQEQRGCPAPPGKPIGAAYFLIAFGGGANG